MVIWVDICAVYCCTSYAPHSALNNMMLITVSLCINSLKFRSVKHLTSGLDFCCVKKWSVCLLMWHFPQVKAKQLPAPVIIFCFFTAYR
jgi:hypothetical protein